MNIKIIVLLLLIISAGIMGCDESPEEYPLSWEEDKMVKIIADLRVIDNQIKKHHIEERDSVKNLYENILYKAHRIEKTELIKNLALMQKDPKLAKKIEDLAIKYTSGIKDSLDMDSEIE
jgi:hypothetical protein